MSQRRRRRLSLRRLNVASSVVVFTVDGVAGSQRVQLRQNVIGGFSNRRTRARRVRSSSAHDTFKCTASTCNTTLDRAESAAANLGRLLISKAAGTDENQRLAL